MSPGLGKYSDESFPLDSVAIAMVAELREQMKPAQIALQTVLAYFARQHELAAGNWQLAENGRELIRAAGAPSRAEAFSRAGTCDGAGSAPASQDTATEAFSRAGIRSGVGSAPASQDITSEEGGIVLDGYQSND